MSTIKESFKKFGWKPNQSVGYVHNRGRTWAEHGQIQSSPAVPAEGAVCALTMGAMFVSVQGKWPCGGDCGELEDEKDKAMLVSSTSDHKLGGLK